MHHQVLYSIHHTGSTRLNMGRHALVIRYHTSYMQHKTNHGEACTTNYHTSYRQHKTKHGEACTSYHTSYSQHKTKHGETCTGYHTSQAAQDLTWGDMHWLSHFTGSIRLRKDGCYILELSFPKKILRQATMRQHEDFSAKISNMKNVCPSESK